MSFGKGRRVRRRSMFVELINPFYGPGRRGPDVNEKLVVSIP